MAICNGSRIAVIGYGSWATALVSVLTGNGNGVSWYIRNPEILESVKNDGVNCKYLQNLDLDRNLIRASDDLDGIVSSSDVLIMAMPSAYIRDFLSPLTVSLKGKFIISAIKGIIPELHLTVSEFFHREYDVPYDSLGVICGPTHAEEVSQRHITYITVACTDAADSLYIGNLLSSRYLKVSYSSSVYGVEYAAVLKNVYAIAAGMATGLGFGDNFLAVLVSGCCDEMKMFLDVTNPSGAVCDDRNSFGDLLVTCYSPFSRNRRLGQLIGKGCTVKSALNEMTMVAEGYFAAEGLHFIKSRFDVEMPIADTVYNVLYNKVSARKAMLSLAAVL